MKMKQSCQSNHFSICLGREIGSGGREVALRVSRILDASFYDKEIIYHSAQESGISSELFEKVDEKPKKSLITSLLGVESIFPYTGNMNNINYLCDEELFKIQSQVIMALAEKGPSVFVGRCADYVLREKRNMFSLFICADYDDRVSRLSSVHGYSEKEAKSIIEEIDKKRAEYYNYYTFKKWGAASSYDMCLNTSVLGIDRCVSIVEGVIRDIFL
jgi:cytidylate kinase